MPSSPRSADHLHARSRSSSRTSGSRSSTPTPAGQLHRRPAGPEVPGDVDGTRAEPRLAADQLHDRARGDVQPVPLPRTRRSTSTSRRSSIGDRGRRPRRRPRSSTPTSSSRPGSLRSTECRAPSRWTPTRTVEYAGRPTPTRRSSTSRPKLTLRPARTGTGGPDEPTPNEGNRHAYIHPPAPAGGRPPPLVISFLAFLLLYRGGGDIARRILGENATAETVAQKAEELGLNRPMIVAVLGLG